MTFWFAFACVFAVCGIVFAWLAACGALDQAEREAHEQERRAGTAPSPCPKWRASAQRSGGLSPTGRRPPRSLTKER